VVTVVGPGGHPTGKRSSGMPYPSTMLERFMPCLQGSTGLRPAHSPPGALVMQPSMAISSRTRPTMRSVEVEPEPEGLDGVVPPVGEVDDRGAGQPT
jgi:hypothetical protein